MNKLAKRVTEAEGLKKQVNIAQVKEVMRVLFNILAHEEAIEIAEILKKYK